MVHSGELVDEGLKPTGRRFPNIRRRRIVGPLEHSCIPLYPGFCCTFARALVDEVRWDAEDPRNQHTHDSWICFLANVLGRTYYVPEALVLYRRHDSTVTGNYGRRPVSAIINNARSASSGDYRRYSRIISGYADLLQSRGGETRDRAVSVELRRAGAHYTGFAGWLQTRAQLYEAGASSRG